jgi:hypothetical protein
MLLGHMPTQAILRKWVDKTFNLNNSQMNSMFNYFLNNLFSQQITKFLYTNNVNICPFKIFHILVYWNQISKKPIMKKINLKQNYQMSGTNIKIKS